MSWSCKSSRQAAKDGASLLSRSCATYPVAPGCTSAQTPRAGNWKASPRASAPCQARSPTGRPGSSSMESSTRSMSFQGKRPGFISTSATIALASGFLRPAGRCSTASATRAASRFRRFPAARAARGYKDINLNALKLLRPGGLLAPFSCSGGVSPELFQKIVAGAAADAGASLVLRERFSAAPDHPVLVEFPEGEYLKGLLLERR